MSVEFRPTPLGPRRRRVDPVVVGSVVVTLAIGLAVLKPWGGGERGAPTAAPAATRSAGATAAAAPSVAVRPAGEGSRPVGLPSWAQVEAAVSPRPAWGVRALVVIEEAGVQGAGPTPRYVERWSAAGPPDAGAPTATMLTPAGPQGTVLRTAGAPVVALGLTTPPGDVPIAVRAWRLSAGGRLDWLALRPLDEASSRAALLFAAPPARAPGTGGWTPGAYRFDVLSGGGVGRLWVLLADAEGRVPFPVGEPEPVEGPDPRPGPAGPPGDLPVGAFATVGTAVLPLPGEAGGPLDEAAAWLDAPAGPGGGTPRVARLSASGVTAIGVQLERGARIDRAVIRRVTPGPALEDVRLTESGDGPPERRPRVAFRPVEGGAWEPGVYALEVAWREPGGAHRRTWHVEIAPGVAQPSRILRSTRDWARHAGRAGFVVGTADPLEGGPRAVAIRLVAPGRRAPAGLADPRAACPGAVVEGGRPAIGVAFPVDDPPIAITAARRLPAGASLDQPLLVAPVVVPGLSVVAPADGAAFPIGVYDIGLVRADGIEARTLCIADPTVPAAGAAP